MKPMIKSDLYKKLLKNHTCQPAIASGIVVATDSFTSTLGPQRQTGAVSAIAQGLMGVHHS